MTLFRPPSSKATIYRLPDKIYYFKNILSFLSFIFLIPFSSNAQDTCVYQLNLIDSFGDGWENSFISVTINEQQTTYTLGDGDDDESFQSIDILVATGDSLSLRYGSEGTPVFQNEISYQLFDADGLVVLQDGPNPETGLILSTEITCPTCFVLNDALVRISEVTASSATVFWDIEEREGALVEWGEMDFELGTGMNQQVNGGSAVLNNLAENTNYELYLSSVCEDGTVSKPIGPFSFKTLFINPPDTCFYTLRMLDFFGDGWNGSSVTTIVNGESNNFTLLDGAIENVQIPALSNLPFQFFYNEGLFDEEISYVLLDPDGEPILSDGPSPQGGLVLETIACPSCPAPINPQANPSAERAEITWANIPAASQYILEFGLAGFELGTGLEVVSTVPMMEIPNLKENTTYEYYLLSTCGEETSLQVVGPFSFTTLFKTDVGIANITMPVTNCGLGVSEMIEIELKNFGANPQSLITYKFSVNGIDGGVPIPTDGFYTGIISKDSIATIEFETPTDLMNPGVYEIAVWTELEGDNNSSNDTSVVIVTNIPTIQQLPYSEFFEQEGGWIVATESAAPSWNFGSPTASLVPQTFSGEQVWATNTTGTYNQEEISYLVSPCFDFSSFTADPIIAFRFFMEAPDFSETRLFLEMSLNGERWQRVGPDGEGFNWYNNDTQTAWTGNASGGTWLYAEQELLSTAGIQDVRLRFAFVGDEEAEGFGVAVDDVHIFEPTTTNVVARSVTNLVASGCGALEDKVALLFRNSGTTDIQQVSVGYRVNTQEVVIETVDSLLAPGESMMYEFETPFNSTAISTYRIQSWVSLSGDNTPISDTTYATFEVAPPLPLPLIEDFDDSQVDSGWFIINGDIELAEPEDHNNASVILSDNLWFGNPISEFITASYGPINEGDSLSFVYRLADWPDATVPLELTEDTLTVGASTDCGATFTTIFQIHQGNHISTADFTEVKIPLADYVGQGVAFSFQMRWGNGDYWFDIDDINVLSCPATLALTAEVVEATGEEINDGIITIIPTQGSGAYDYDWINFETTTDSLSSLLPGDYQVVVTDDLLGCQDSITVSVGVLSTSVEDVALIEELVIYPNPTNHSAQLVMSLQSPEAITIHIHNGIGQSIKTANISPSQEIRQDLYLGDLPKGIYWVRIGVGEATVTRKVFKIE